MVSSRGSQPKPSFATGILGRGASQYLYSIWYDRAFHRHQLPTPKSYLRKQGLWRILPQSSSCVMKKLLTNVFRNEIHKFHEFWIEMCMQTCILNATKNVGPWVKENHTTGLIHSPQHLAVSQTSRLQFMYTSCATPNAVQKRKEFQIKWNLNKWRWIYTMSSLIIQLYIE